MNSEFTGFSIIVCTHNGVSRLSNTLQHLDNLKLDIDIEYEVIVVDNASVTDSNSEIIKLFSALQRIDRFTLLHEPQKGKDLALLLGIKKLKYKWVIVCDDDNWLNSDYIVIAKSLIYKFSDAVVFGSRSIPCFSNESIVPKWFVENSLKYACGKQYENSSYVSYRQDLWGAGCIYRKDVLFNALTVSNLLLSKTRGEDSEIFYRIIILGHKAYYSDDLFLYHHITDDRLDFENHLKMMAIDEKSKPTLDKYNQFIKYYFLNNKRILSILKWNLIGFLKYLGINIYRNSHKSTLMISLMTSFINDKDFRRIKEFYYLTRSKAKTPFF
jgi:glycosyltransferase involved in cell wall biosynthesis